MPELKSALAVKIIDGAKRAAEVAIAGLISELKIINNDQIEKIKNSPIKNSAGQIIGSMKCTYANMKKTIIILIVPAYLKFF